MNLRITRLALVPVAALVLTACGGASEEEYADAMSSGLASAESQPLTEAKADCVSDDFVGRLGLDRVEEIGDPADLEVAARSLSFTGLGLTEAEGNELFDDFVGCGADMEGRVMAELETQGLALPEEMLECVEGALSEGELRSYFVPLMRTGEAEVGKPMMAELERELVTCADAMTLTEG